jgi:O-antigen/teichoic acid export membrane protein
MSESTPGAAPALGGLTARSATVTFAAQTVARGITLAVVAASTAVVTRAVGIDTYADWATILSLVALLGFLLDPALSPVIVRRLAQEPESAPSPEATRRVRALLGLGALVLVIAASLVLRGPHTFALAVALGSQVVPRALVLNATPWLQADHRLHRQTAWEAVTAALGLAALVIAAALGGSPVLLALVGFTIPAVVLAAIMRRELRLAPSTRLPPPGPQGPRVRSVLHEIAPLAGALVLLAAYTRSYTFFVNAAENATNVARYLFAFIFIEQVFVVSAILAAAVLPLLAVRARAHELFRDGLTHDFMVAVAGLGALGSAALLATAPLLCRVFGGPQLAPADRYLELLTPMVTIVPIAFLLGYLHMAVGLGRRYLRINVAALAMNLAGNGVLTLTFGAAAAARVSWATEALVVSLALVPIARMARSGARATARIAALFVTAVVCAELVGVNALPPAAGGAVVVIIAALLAGRELATFVRAARVRSEPAG